MPTKESTKTQIVPTDIKPEEIAEIMRENLGADFDLNQLQKIGTPGSGGDRFVIDDLDGEQKVESMEVIITKFARGKVFWGEGEPVLGEPPKCNSTDRQIGNGTPGGNCKTCAFNQYGSKGDGKACKDVIVMFVCHDGNILPSKLVLSTMSARNFDRYATKLLSKRFGVSSCVTKLTIEQKQNKSGIKYPEIQFNFVRRADEKEAPILHEIKNSLLSITSSNFQQIDTIDG